MKKFLSLFFKLGLTASIFYFVFNQFVNFERLVTVIREIDIWLLVVVLLIYSISRVVQAYQTQICFIPYRIHFGLWETYKIQLVSAFYSLVLPGDLFAGGVTWHLMSRDSGHRAQVASVLTYLRLLNLITLLPFAALGLIFEPVLIQMNAHIFLIITTCILVIPSLPFFWRPAAQVGEEILSKITNKLPWERVRLAFDNMWMSIHICNEMPTGLVFKLVFLSFLMQLMGLLLFWCCILSVNMTVPASTILWLRALIIIIQTLPLTISGLGVREFTVVTLLDKLYHVDNESAFLLSLMVFFVMIVFGGILGGFFAVTLKKKTGKLIEEKNEPILTTEQTVK